MEEALQEFAAKYGVDASKPGKFFPKYKGYMVYHFVPLNMPDMEVLDVEEGDIFVASYPKSGTTWLQQIVYLIYNGVDVEEASQKLLIERFPFMERPAPLSEKDQSIDIVKMMPHPRLLKTHLPFDFLPEQLQKGKGKVFYVARNPKDAIVSHFFFSKRFPFFDARQRTMEDEVYYFTSGLSPMSPWWKHVLSYWKRRNEPHITFVTYEALHRNFRAEVKRIAASLGVLLTDEQVEVIERQCSFSTMKQDRTTNFHWEHEQGVADESLSKFMRKGKIGDWKNHLTDEMSKLVDRYVDKYVTPEGLTFEYE